jgi:peroxiredoxin
MKRSRFFVFVSTACLLAVVVGLGAVLAAEAGKSLSLGAMAPAADVKMKGVDGREVSIADVRGEKGTLVIFTCNHCPWVKAWETRIVEIGNTWASKGFGVIAINSNDPAAYAEDSFDEMQRRARERGMRFPYVVDGSSEVARAFGASHTPEVFLFGAGGVLVYKGTVDDNAKEPDKVKSHYLADALAAVAAGKEPAVRETKSLGCSIKFRPVA